MADLPAHPGCAVRGRRPDGTIGRIVAARLAEVFGQAVVVENVGGAGGMIGSARVAKATPDGYQFGLGNIGTHAHNQTLYRQPQYNAATISRRSY